MQMPRKKIKPRLMLLQNDTYSGLPGLLIILVELISKKVTLPSLYAMIKKKTYRSRQDSNLRGETPSDFESDALTTRPRLLWIFSSNAVFKPNIGMIKTRVLEKKAEEREEKKSWFKEISTNLATNV